MKTLREAVKPRDSYSLTIGSDPGVDLDPYDARTRDFLSSHAVLDAPYPEGAEAAFTGGNDVKYAMDDPRMSRYGNRKGDDKSSYDPQDPKNLPPQPTTESYSNGGEPELAAWAVRKDIGWGKRNPGLHGVTVAKHKSLEGVYHVKHSAGGAHVHLAGKNNYHHRNGVNSQTTVVHDGYRSEDAGTRRHSELYSHPMHEYGEHKPIDHDTQKNLAVVNEHLTKSSSASAWIKDFMKSKNSRFDGKSGKERRRMALGAYYAKHDESVDEAFHVHGGGKKRDTELGLKPSGQNSAPIEGNIVGAAFKAQGGRTVPFKHQDGSVTHVHPAMGRRISASIQNAPNRERADLVQRMHRSADHLKHAIGEDETQSERAWREAAHEPMRRRANEGVEAIDELSKKTLGSYALKASDSANHHAVLSTYGGPKQRQNDYRLALKRRVGMKKAIDKLTSEDIKDSETIDELSHRVMGNYVKKAANDLARHSVIASYAAKRAKPEEKNEIRNRQNGIAHAVNRLTREDLDDASPVTANAIGDAGTLMTQLRALANKAIAAVIAMPDDMKPQQWVCDAVKRANEEISRVHDCMAYGDHPDNQGPIDPVDVAAEEGSIGGME